MSIKQYTRVSSIYLYVRARQLEGSFPGDHLTGTHLISTCRINKGWGIATEADWPYSDTWPPVEPANIDLKAKARRIGCYYRVRTIDECKIVIASQTPVLASFHVKPSWFNSSNGVIPYEDEEETIGAHTIVLVGYDDMKEHFILRNSWGKNWGDRGYGYLSYEAFEKLWIESWALLDTPSVQTQFVTGLIERSWALKNPLEHTIHVRDLYDKSNDIMIGWSFGIERDATIEIEDLFVRPEYRNMGYGKKLLDGLNEVSLREKIPLAGWVSWADSNSTNIENLKGFIASTNLTLVDSKTKWASYFAYKV